MDPIIRAITYDTEVGSMTAFAYRQGTFIDERELNLEKNLENAFHYGNGEYLNYLSEKYETCAGRKLFRKNCRKDGKKRFKRIIDYRNDCWRLCKSDWKC